MKKGNKIDVREKGMFILLKGALWVTS